MFFTVCRAAAKLTAKLRILYHLLVFLAVVKVKPFVHQMAQMCLVFGGLTLGIFLNFFLSHEISFSNFFMV
jgi:hypothetical protein